MARWSKQALAILAASTPSLVPPPELTVASWAEHNRHLSSEASAVRGKWVSWPFQKEPMECVSPSHPCERVVLMCGSQLMKTEVILNLLGFVIDVDPGPVLIVEPREEDAKALSKDRIAPMIRDTVSLRGKVMEVKSRDSGNTTLHKKFRGGHVTLVGAISPSGLAMRPIRYLCLDEVDRYTASAGTEGDPCALAEKRTENFPNRKIVMASTPTVDGSSRIQRAYQQSDQRQFYVPCPFCGHRQVLVFDRVRWGTRTGYFDGSQVLESRDIAVDDAHYECEGCSGFIPHYRKPWMLENGAWVAQNPGSKIPGFWLSRLYSPIRTWGEIAEQFLFAKTDRETLKVFINTVLAETWKEPGEAPDYRRLIDRAEPFDVEIVPASASVLTLAADVQLDRIECELRAWGPNHESWSIGYHVFNGDTSTDLPWDRLRTFLERDFPHAAGGRIPVWLAGIDCNYRPERTYLFCQRYAQPAYGGMGASINLPRTVIAVRGGNDQQQLIQAISPVDEARKRGGLRIVTIGVSVAKESIYGRLRMPAPAAGEAYPRGWIHLPKYEEWVLQGLTAETKVVTANGKVEWRKDGKRNEPLDCAVYNEALAALLQLDRWTKFQWERFTAMRLQLLPQMASAPRNIEIRPIRPADPWL
jgi:phage terminase large subunit GpA-like protein